MLFNKYLSTFTSSLWIFMTTVSSGYEIGKTLHIIINSLNQVEVFDPLLNIPSAHTNKRHNKMVSHKLCFIISIVLVTAPGQMKCTN